MAASPMTSQYDVDIEVFLSASKPSGNSHEGWEFNNSIEGICRKFCSPVLEPLWSLRWQVKCGSCGSVSDKDSTITTSEQYPIPKSRGQAHLVQKCKFCESVGNISLVEGRGKPYNIEDSELSKFGQVACFDCRGIEPVELSWRDGWSAEGLSGTNFENIDLSDGEWSEYDERGSASVGILNIEYRFDHMK